MKKKLLFLFTCVLAVNLYAQLTEAQVLSYKRNFARANLNTKYQLVQDASKNTCPELASFFLDSLNYVDAAYDVLGADSTLIQMGNISVNALSQLKYTDALLPIRLLYIKIKDDRFKQACVRAFQSFEVKDEKLITELNSDFEKSFYSYLSGQIYSQSLLIAYAECLGVIGNEESFNLVFKSLTQADDETFKKACTQALSKISVNIFDQLVTIIKKKDIYYTWTAFDIAQKSAGLTENQLATITELCLEVALDSMAIQPQLSSDLIDKTLQLLTAKKWQQATDLVVSYFYRAQADFRAGKTSAVTLVQVIDCLAVSSSKEAANALVVFLGLLNSDTEKGLAYSEPVVLATINALGELGDNNAFDYLVYVDYLNYSENIKKAARDSIARLQW